MGDLASIVGAGGFASVLGILVYVVLQLLSANRAIPKQYEELVERLETKVKTGEAREVAAQEMLVEVRKALFAAERRVAQLEIQVERLGGSP